MPKKKSLVDHLLAFLSGEAPKMMQGVGKSVDSAIEKAEKKIEDATIKAIKASLVFVMLFLGLIFALVGVSSYITVAFDLDAGIGLIAVGATLILLGWFAKLVR